MDCSNNQWGGCLRRPQMPQPPCMNTDFPSQNPAMPLDTSCLSNCKMPKIQPEFGAGMPIGMGYVPWQRWCPIYPMDRAIERGTIFPELDLPFTRGRCRR